MYSARLVTTLNDIANSYVDLIYSAVHDVLSQKPYKNTGRGADSLEVSVTPGDANKAPIIQITFDEHLITMTSSNLQWTKLPNMDEMKAWAKTKESDEKKADKLAWAVGWDKVKNDTWKPKRWRKPALSKVLKEMNALIVSEFDKAIEADLVESARVL